MGYMLNRLSHEMVFVFMLGKTRRSGTSILSYPRV
jgi:hypothetical protein